MSKSFLKRFIDSFKERHTLTAGKESILVDAKDLFVNSFYHYIKLRFENFGQGINVFKKYKLDKKDSIQIVQEKDNSYTLKVRYINGEKQIHNIEKLFEDIHGNYNVKGYYDENTVEKFNKILFQLFDEITGIKI